MSEHRGAGCSPAGAEVTEDTGPERPGHEPEGWRAEGTGEGTEPAAGAGTQVRKCLERKLHAGHTFQ